MECSLIGSPRHLLPARCHPRTRLQRPASRLPVTGNKPKLQLDTVGRIVPILLLSAFEDQESGQRNASPAGKAALFIRPRGNLQKPAGAKGSPNSIPYKQLGVLRPLLHPGHPSHAPVSKGSSNDSVACLAAAIGLTSHAVHMLTCMH